MRATLDHIGIAVANAEEALRFYRDALGLEIEAPEEVPSQHVRAHFIASLKSRGVRLIDEAPRPGAHGSLVAFIHPSSAHGVLVELKQA